MSLTERLREIVHNIPEVEHAAIARLLEYQLTLLTYMPEQQRQQEYERADLALSKYATESESDGAVYTGQPGVNTSG